MLSVTVSASAGELGGDDGLRTRMLLYLVE